MCSMHPDPAKRGCEAEEEGLGEDEVTTQVEVEDGICGTPGCTLPDFHLGPCSMWLLAGPRKRGRRGEALVAGTCAPGGKAVVK